MERNYLLAYTIFSAYYNRGFKTYYRHFETLEKMNNFIEIHKIQDSHIAYKKLEEENQC